MDEEKRKEQKRIAAKTYRDKHPDIVKQRNKEQYEKKRKERISYARQYYENNKDALSVKDKLRYESNKNIQSKKYKDFRKENPDFVRQRDRGYYLKKKYGLSVVQLAEMWTNQNGECANSRCKEKLTKGTGGYCVDHCHETGKIRGLLCMKCNVSLGHLKDSIPKLMGLIFYLKGFNHDA